MTKASKLLSLLEDMPGNNAVDPMQKQLQKDGIRTQKSGNTVTLTSIKTGKKVVLKDNGRQMVAKKIQNGKPNGPDDKFRGTAGDVQREIDWMKTK
jgi:hypothetical protein